MDRSLQHAFEPEEVMAYLDGELEPRRAAALAGHLDRCTECQDVARELRLVSGRMMNFEIEPAPASITAAALATFNSPARPEPVKPRSSLFAVLSKGRQFAANRIVWALAGGFAIVVAVVALVSVSHLRPSREVPNLAGGHRDEGVLPASPRPGTAERSYKLWRQEDAADLQRAREAMLDSNAVSTSGPAQQSAESAPPPPPPPADRTLQAPESVGPMIVQTASLSIVSKNYDEASASIEKLAKSQGGYVEKLDAKAQTGNARELSIALRIPDRQLDGFLVALRQLGRVEQESQSNEEVSAEYVDLQARLRSAQATERRLIELLATRTGRLEDVLDVERELARVREEIESMQGQRAVLVHRVSYATVQVELSEEYHEKLQSGTSTGTKLHNALIEGIHNLQEGIVAVLIFALNDGPAILFWLLILFGLYWLVWRRFRRRRVARS
jgi:hypothetical protein